MEQLTSAELADIDAYHAPLYALAAFDTFVAPLLFAAFVFLGTAPLYTFASRLAERWAPKWPRLSTVATRLWGEATWLNALLFALLFFVIVTAASLPQTIYFDFVHEHAFEMSNETAGRFAKDVLKGFALFGASLAALAFGVFALARRLRSWWWVTGAVAGTVMLISSLIDPYRSQLFFKQHSLEDGPLRARITALMHANHVSIQDVLVDETLVSTRRAQAYFAGQGPTRSIVLNDAMLKSMSEDEIMAAVAHELGHVHENKWLGRIAASLIVLLFLGFIEWLFRASARYRWFGASARADLRVLPLILLTLDLAITVTAPLTGFFKREREREADRVALEQLQQPLVFEQMLVKLVRLNKIDPTPPQWLVWSGAAHPPIAERIRAAREWKSTRQPSAESVK